MPITNIPEALLKTFECGECGRYLSSSPIGMRLDNVYVCSVCYDETATRCCLVEALAALHKFPCNYRAQGCPEYLAFNNTSSHEDNCAHQVHVCPLNLYSSCSWAGVSKQIYSHYKKQHPEFKLKHPSYKISLSQNYEWHSYIVSINQVNLILTTEHFADTNILRFNAIYVGDVNNAALIKYRVKLSNEHNCGRIMELEENTASPLTVVYQPKIKEYQQIDVVDLIGFLQNPKAIHCHWNFIFPDNLQQFKSVKPKANSTMCPICSFGMVPPIHRCIAGHISCGDCKGYENFCKICQRYDVSFTRAIDLEDIAIDSQYYCRWKHCIRCFDCFTIKQHEQECFKRIYECPTCLELIGTYKDIFKHFCRDHSNFRFIFTKGDCIKLTKKMDTYYVLVSRELFRINILEPEPYKWIIDIVYFGTPSLNNWKYEVRSNCNVLHYASKYCHNQYRLTHDEYTDVTHKQCYFKIRFVKQQPTLMMWMPYEPPCERTYTESDY